MGTFIGIFSETAALPDKEWNALCCEYSALFEGTDGRFLPLWASAFFEEGVLLNKLTLEITLFFRKMGLGLSGRCHELPDHIGIECAFMYQLMILGVAASERESYPTETEQLDAQRAFLKEYLLPFGEAFCLALKSRTEHAYWKALADCFCEFLEEDAEYMQAALPTGPDIPTLLAVNDNFLAGLFTILEPKERVEKQELLVPVSGTNNCGGRCQLVAQVQDGVIPSLAAGRHQSTENNEAQLLCVRGLGYRKAYLSTLRLRYPMKRIGERGEGRFARISWDEALDEITWHTKNIKDRFGPASRYVNYATGVTGVLRGDQLARHLLALDGGYLGLYNTYSAACAEISTPYVFGTLLTGSTSDTLLNAKLIILWGHNPIETIFGPATRRDLMRAKKKGIKIISVDPRYSDSTVVYADEWIGIRPTTDSALVDAMAYVILTEKLHDQHFMDTYCLGFDREHMPQGLKEAENYVDYCLGRSDGTPKTPQWAEVITGVAIDVIIRLARELALSKPASLLPGLGYQRHGNGEQAVRSLAMLACLTGNVGVRGGNAAGQNYVHQHYQPVARLTSNPLGLSIPSFLWTDAVTRGSEMTVKDGIRGAEQLPSPIKMIFNLAGNTLINQHSDIRKTAKILKDTSLCQVIVCSDVFMTPSAKFADLLLPGTSLFETSNIYTPWRQGDYLLYNNGAIRPLYESRFEYDWLTEVADRLGLKTDFTKGHGRMEDWLRDIYNETRCIEKELPPYEEFTRSGGYQYKKRTSYVAFEEEIGDPAHHPFPTPSGKIEIFSPRLHDMHQPEDIPAIPKYVPSFEGPADEKRHQYPLQLIGWHIKTRCHSIHFGCNDPHDAAEDQVLWMNPHDALSRSISDGDEVEVWNDRGAIHLKSHVTDRIVGGVVAMPQGAWYRPDSNGVDQNGSLNVLTTLRPTPLAKGNPQHSNLVEVKPIRDAW